ncbi:capsule assembly Wzi family protein [Nibrella saemangeumensis]|uniref:Capsule assembly Wzi family protein n=1 Tax=Nibrella saemangeumensis TaxID=1084526 RepID=A0ABP8MWK4_9BACT
MKFLPLGFLGLFITVQQTLAQSAPNYTYVEAGGAAASTDRTPFWLHANQFGIVPKEGPFGTARAGIYRDYRLPSDSAGRLYPKRLRLDWGYGLSVVSNIASKSSLLLPDVYAKARVGIFEARAGRWRQVIGLADSTLGVGPYSWSGNALPIPRIEVSIPTFTPIGFTRGLLAVQGAYAHGWFDNQGGIKNFYLHQKALYLRLGKESWPVRFYGGLNHQAQWGGRSDINNPLFVKSGRLPSTFRDYIDVVLGTSLPARATVDTTRLPTIDSNNRIGNHLGSADVGVEIQNAGFSVMLYRQFLFDDGSLFYGNNITDGLTGVRFRNRKPVNQGFQLRQLVLEVLDTRSQGGPEFTFVDKTRGQDEYFNNYQYIDGWAYLGRTLGTPFITPQTDSRAGLPRMVAGPNDLRRFTNNNRVLVFHAGLAGTVLRDYTFQLKCSVSDNRGRYIAPFPYHTWQVSSYARFGIPLNASQGLWAHLTVASDNGLLYRNSTGFYFSIRKEWLNGDNTRLIERQRNW